MKPTPSDVAVITSCVIECNSLLSSLDSRSRDRDAYSSVSELSGEI